MKDAGFGVVIACFGALFLFWAYMIGAAVTTDRLRACVKHATPEACLKIEGVLK
jgi:hypothetical protein